MDRPFIRTEMLTAKAPPHQAPGPVKWVQENLFSTWLNTILTVLGIAVVFWLIWTAFPWWSHSVWKATSLRECRETVAAMGGESGACWAVIRHWWASYIFGFYPKTLYWRPLLTLALLFAALAPVLFWRLRSGAWLIAVTGGLVLVAMLALSVPVAQLLTSAAILGGLLVVALLRPRLLILVPLLYPFAAIWLLWGGQIWVPLSALLALALGVLAGMLYGRLRSDPLITVYAVAVAIGAAVVASALVNYTYGISSDFLGKMSDAHFYPAFLSGSGPLPKVIGALLSSVIWLISMIAWALIAILSAVSGVLHLNVSQLIDVPYAGYIGVGSVLAAIGAFNATRKRTAGIGIFGGIVAAGAYWVLAHPWIVKTMTGALPFGLRPVNSDDFGGFLLAIVIGVTAISASLPLGILLALGRRSDMFLVKILSVGFIEFIRGVPLITLLFTASLLLAYFLPPGTNFDLILRVIILASLFASAYIAEVVRGGLAALPRGQYEAADALGLDYWQAQRLIIMPQALKISIPGIVSTFIGLFKDTTLVAYVGLLDPLIGVTRIVRADINWKGIYWEPYIFVGVIFFLICFGMSRYSMYLEKKLKTDHR